MALRHSRRAKGVAVKDPIKTKRKRAASALERQFAMLWRVVDGPQLTPEWRFDEVRRWRFDFAHRESRVAIEIEGGVWSGGRHTRGAGFVGDCEKYLEAHLAGWRVMRLTKEMITYANCLRIKEYIKKEMENK
jgi:very-short-patch-repair endonuclease